MNPIRIIPRLDIKGPNLVKGIHLEGLRVLGKPEGFAKYYYEAGADELFFQDVVASLYDRNSLGDIITKTAEQSFIPLTVGGGLRTLQDITHVLRAGADKVSINTAAIKDPVFIQNAALKFGSSTIVVAIEAIKERNGKYLVYTDNGREYTGIDAVEWAKKAADLGCGEIVVTSVDKEGTGEGFDVALVQQICSAVNVPVIAHGGASSAENIYELITSCDVAAVAISSILHYHALHEVNLENADYSLEGNTSFMDKKVGFGKIKPTTLPQIKEYLYQKNIPIRSI